MIKLKGLIKETHVYTDADDYYGEVQGALADIIYMMGEDTYGNDVNKAHKQAVDIVTRFASIVDDGFANGTNPEEIADELMKQRNK